MIYSKKLNIVIVNCCLWNLKGIRYRVLKVYWQAQQYITSAWLIIIYWQQNISVAKIHLFSQKFLQKFTSGKNKIHRIWKLFILSFRKSFINKENRGFLQNLYYYEWAKRTKFLLCLDDIQKALKPLKIIRQNWNRFLCPF